MAHGLLGVAWLVAGWTQSSVALFALGWPVLLVAAASAGYSAFLFGQAEGRDFWQSPLVLPHLLVAAVTAGCASLLLAALAVSSDPRVAEGAPHGALVLARPERRRALRRDLHGACHPGRRPRRAADHAGSVPRPLLVGRRAGRHRRAARPARGLALSRGRPSRRPCSRSAASGSGKTSGCAPARRCRFREDAAHDRRTASPARPRPRPAGARAQPLSARRAVGRLGGVRLESVAETRAAALLAHPHHLLQLRGGLRAPRLRGQADAQDPEVRGQPRAPGQPRPQLRQGPGHAQPGAGPGAHPLPAASARASAGKASGSASAGTRCWTTSAGASAQALVEGRQKEIMYHLGRPGHELVYLQRVFHAWGIDGHNSHTNVCSAGARAGYAFWHGFDRPSPDHAARASSCSCPPTSRRGTTSTRTPSGSSRARWRAPRSAWWTRGSRNTASMADYWLSPWPGTEAAHAPGLRPRPAA